MMAFKKGYADCPKLAERSCSIFGEVSRYQSDKGGSITYTFEWDKGKIVYDLEGAIEFWRGNRDAIPTKVQVKCLACHHKRRCEFSLA